MEYTLSFHASQEIENRQIPLELLEMVLNEPQQIYVDEFDILVYQSVLGFPNSKKYLLRIFLADKDPKHIITIYRTSKIDKYWRKSLWK